ncbi:MAG: phosphoglycerate mutase [Candidatus Nitrohelix vancouverensis]|uniref:Phosphoglycerate mutase n=1 Tax=Candidatus Nitrohelix vancouverensis TaxID=2705534 RepID=A0A7T0BZS0_9BACT|nr:MAG: phosphoglycerate mutase [Candidatus Nitrohelix vancouverensis]
MKYIIIVGNGLTDQPVAERDNRTPLQLADIPNLDGLARNGSCGSLRAVPEDMTAGNDVSYTSLLGFAPEQYQTGSAHYIARALGIDTGKGETPLCCDFIILQSSHNDMVMKDFTAGELDSAQSKELLEALGKNIYDIDASFHPGRGFRNLMVLKNATITAPLESPYELIGEGIRKFLPAEKETKDLAFIMNQAQIILHNHPFNQSRRQKKLDMVNSVWLWGTGVAQDLPNFEKSFGRKALVISPDLLLQGMARSAGMDVDPLDEERIQTETGYKELADAALDALDRYDVVYVHATGAELPSLRGMIDEKILAIEDFDSELVGPLAQAAEQRGDARLLVAINHSASVVNMRYGKEPTPFVVYPAVDGLESAQDFDESIATKKSGAYENGPDFITAMLGGPA